MKTHLTFRKIRTGTLTTRCFDSRNCVRKGFNPCPLLFRTFEDDSPESPPIMERSEKLLPHPGAEENGKEKSPKSPSSYKDKAAYFDLLRLWVNQTVMHQNASQCFPYYMMANSQQSFHPANVLGSPVNPILLDNGATERAQRDEGAL